MFFDSVWSRRGGCGRGMFRVREMVDVVVKHVKSGTLFSRVDCVQRVSNGVALLGAAERKY